VHWFKAAAALSAALALAGCANGYAQFYQPVTTAGLVHTVPFSGRPTVLASSGDMRADELAAFTLGLAVIGRASFNGPEESLDRAIAQAQKVGASHILVAARYARTVSGAIPITTNQTYTTNSSGTVNAFGSGGFATGSYMGTSTTTVPTTTYIPYQVDRYDQAALFLAPLERRGLGVRIVPPTPEQVQQVGTNKVVFVQAVRRGSPAFLADVFPGDFIETINDTPVYDSASAAAALNFDAPIRVKLLRKGAEITKVITTGPGGAW
jgi:hypothetical protein